MTIDSSHKSSTGASAMSSKSKKENVGSVDRKAAKSRASIPPFTKVFTYSTLANACSCPFSSNAIIASMWLTRYESLVCLCLCSVQVVFRGLPPTISERQFLECFPQLPAYDWLSVHPPDPSCVHSLSSFCISTTPAPLDFSKPFAPYRIRLHFRLCFIIL